ncbi:uncharacterized protein F4822DRAFT_441022 [Hypoxylon trugodes]|uniref:uncharacterized protein n=1 Tax=Hypoxylon trugodes TaxID=326681 RepID=UPI00218F9261|nr:uncharacterized protein F4822DRAFT_441022 [Hypoxylon trugodes]KAI1382587.1 hypothetical protein F4822DRAFT_441022 [Hypoxylon trugodes]
MTQTVLDFLLSQGGHQIDASRLNAGQNTEQANNPIEIETIVRWTEFTYENMLNMFKEELGSEYRGPAVPAPLGKDLIVWNEEGVQDSLQRTVGIPVNYALAQLSGAPHYGRGTRCGLRQMKDCKILLG